MKKNVTRISVNKPINIEIDSDELKALTRLDPRLFRSWVMTYTANIPKIAPTN